MALPFLACMLLTAQVYHLPPRVLPSIHAVEGGFVGSLHANRDGTQDLGVMQINTLWLAPLAEVARMTPAAVRDRLVSDACFNIAASALILRAYLRETRGDLMRAIGDYHSHTPPLNQAYQSAVMARAAALFQAIPPAKLRG